MEDNNGQWETLVVDTDYEIYDKLPYPIRRKDTGRIIGGHTDKDGYYKIVDIEGKKIRLSHLVLFG